jgi:hypothetical protein
MSDIVIYTNPETLEHKKGNKQGEEKYSWFHWTMKRPPKKLLEGDRIYFAINGAVVGSFECEDFRPSDKKETIIWHKYSWKELETPIKTKAFRGFRYKWW